MGITSHTFSLVLQSTLRSMASFVRLVRSLGGRAVVVLHSRSRRHIGTAGALEAKRKRGQSVGLIANV